MVVWSDFCVRPVDPLTISWTASRVKTYLKLFSYSLWRLVFFEKSDEVYTFEFLLGYLSAINPILVPFQLTIPDTGYGRTVKTMTFTMIKPSFDGGAKVLVSFC